MGSSCGSSIVFADCGRSVEPICVVGDRSRCRDAKDRVFRRCTSSFDVATGDDSSSDRKRSTNRGTSSSRVHVVVVLLSVVPDRRVSRLARD